MHVLTLVVDPATTTLDPALVFRVRDAVEGGVPELLSEGEAIDIPCPAPPDSSRIAEALGHAPVDAIATEAGRRRRRLLVADMDSTIVTTETLDQLAAHAGLGEQVAAITRRSMDGETDFASALRERVAMLRGLPLSALEATWAATVLTPGAGELVATMRAHGARTALVSGGFTWFTARVAARCGFHVHHANVLLDDGAALTGRLAEPILDRAAKLATLRALAAEDGLDMADTLAVGDGANDLAMLAVAGLGVAFHARPVVAASARARVDHAGLRALLFAQGFRADEIVQA